MKLIALLLLIASVSFADEAYHPLSKTQRKDFEKTAEAIFEEYQNGNYEVIKRFGNSVLDTYSAIELDPDSKALRPAYLKIKALVSMAAIQSRIDSLTQPVKNATAKGNFLACLESSQNLLTFLENQGLDSLFKARRKNLLNCQSKYFDANKNLSALGQISKYKYFDKTLWDIQSKTVKAESLKEFLIVSASMSSDSLTSFQKRFPGLYTRDIQTLKQKVRSKERLFVLRNPTKESITDFYRSYPEADRELDTVFENLLFKQFMVSGKAENANEYLLNFPTSQRAAVIRRNLESLTPDTAQKVPVSKKEISYLDTPAVPYPGNESR